MPLCSGTRYSVNTRGERPPGDNESTNMTNKPSPPLCAVEVLDSEGRPVYLVTEVSEEEANWWAEDFDGDAWVVNTPAAVSA